MNTWIVARCSTTTGRTLKVLSEPFKTHRHAEVFMAAWGTEASSRTCLRILSRKGS